MKTVVCDETTQYNGWKNEKKRIRVLLLKLLVKKYMKKNLNFLKNKMPNEKKKENMKIIKVFLMKETLIL